jgi:uncharacterized protein YjbI with pentapeptide repeats
MGNIMSDDKSYRDNINSQNIYQLLNSKRDFSQQAFAKGIRIYDMDLSKYCFTGASLNGAQFINCTLNHTNFNKADLTNATFGKSVLNGASLFKQ